jgi:hypothetical protein
MTLDTRLERLLYALALKQPEDLDRAEVPIGPWTAHSVTAGQRAQSLALEFAREQLNQEMTRHIPDGPPFSPDVGGTGGSGGTSGFVRKGMGREQGV